MMVLAVAMVGCEPTRLPEEETDFSPPLKETSDQPPPVLSFPATARTDDPSLNEFIEHVFEVCRVGQYEDYRLLHSRYEQPISRDKFKEFWERVKSITVQDVEPVSAGDAGAEANEPAWKVTAHVVFEPGSKRAKRDIRFVVTREGQRWVVGRQPADVSDDQP
jgi:hypothetical protein